MVVVALSDAQGMGARRNSGDTRLSGHISKFIKDYNRKAPKIALGLSHVRTSLLVLGSGCGKIILKQDSKVRVSKNY